MVASNTSNKSLLQTLVPHISTSAIDRLINDMMKKFCSIISLYIQQMVADANSPNDLTEEEKEAWVDEVNLWEPCFPLFNWDRILY